MLVVNASATGISIDGGPRASYTIVSLKPGIPPRSSMVPFAHDCSNVADDVERRRVPFVPPDLFRGEA